MIELTNAYSYFASAILLLGWILASGKNGSKSVFGIGFFIAFIIYLISSFVYYSNMDDFLKMLSVEMLVLAGASFILTKFKSSILLNTGLFVLMLIGFSQYVFHSDRLGGLKLEAVSMENELLVELDHGVEVAILDNIKESYNLKIEKAYHPYSPDMTELDDFYSIDIPSNSTYSPTEILNQLKKIVGVDWVEYNESINLSPSIEVETILKRTKSPLLYNDILVGQQWAFDVMEMDAYYKFIKKHTLKPKKTALLAILDTGVDSRHEDIAANYISIASKYDDDPKGHGTHCAGIAAAVTNNKIGIASIVPNNNWVNITSVKVLNGSGSGTQNGIIKGIILAADKGADVISMSLGARANLSRERAYKQAIDYANKKGAIVVVAAGNSNLNANTFAPANTHMAITVSAVDSHKDKANFSNYFTDMEYAIAAPGVDILSTVPGGAYKTNSGTSMAAPQVAGLIAMMKAIKPSLNTEEAFHILHESGMETSDTPRTGRLINPKGAIGLLIKK